MDKILSLILLGLAGFKVTQSFFNNMEVGSLFGQEVNIWLYRGVWLLAGILAAASLYRKMKQK